MSRTKRNPPEPLNDWNEDFQPKLKRDGIRRLAPLHKKTKSNRGWASEGFRKPKSKKWFKKKRIKKDRKELNRILKDI